MEDREYDQVIGAETSGMHHIFARLVQHVSSQPLTS